MNIKRLTPIGLVAMVCLSTGLTAAADTGLTEMTVNSEMVVGSKVFNGQVSGLPAPSGGDGGNSGTPEDTETTHNYIATVIIPAQLNQTAGISYEVITTGVNTVGANIFSLVSGTTTGDGQPINVGLSSSNTTADGEATESPSITTIQVRHLDRNNLQYFLIDSIAPAIQDRDANEITYDFGDQTFNLTTDKQTVDVISTTASINFRFHYAYAGSGPVDCVAIKHRSDPTLIKDNCKFYPWFGDGSSSGTLEYSMPNVNLADVSQGEFLIEVFRDPLATDEYNFNNARSNSYAVGLCRVSQATMRVDNQGRYSLNFPTAHLKTTNDVNNTCEGIRP